MDVRSWSDTELAAALMLGERSVGWAEQAAVELICGTGWWLGRQEFRQAVDATADIDGTCAAWVDWDQVDIEAPASGGERRVLLLALSLAGIASAEPLGELLSSLDDRTLAHVLRAVYVAVRGRQAADQLACGAGRSSLWP